MDEAKKKIHNEFKDSILQFYRNGRWGTCEDCPKDSCGKKYPEFCVNTDRLDHKLSPYDLCAAYEFRMSQEA